MGNQRNPVVRAAVFLVAATPIVAADAVRKPYTSWSDYGGAADSMQYSALKQIDKSNVQKLELAWSYLVPDRRGNFGFNPIVVDGVMYVLGQNNAIVALDAATGRQIWSHPADDTIVTQRGINYWHSKDGSDRRLIFAAGQYLTEIDARTGVTINTFGNDGRVNMRVGQPRPLGGPSATPGRVFENLLLVGSQTGEMYGSAPGDLRAYDVRTGKLVWTFHTIPHPGEFGYDTWPKEAWTYVGGVNTWGEISIDEKRGIAYFPLGSPTHDMYGGDRIGAGLYGDCILALDIRTGKRLWHFQVVHHDLWDYDPTGAPKLLTVRHEGKPVDIVALPTKFGLLYVFNRVTGEPLWPIEERPVPKSDVPGEQSWPTQPFPTKPPAFARLQFRVDDINPYVDEAERAQIRQTMLAARNEGLFTPQTLGRNQISVPGELGGANWGGSAADPETGMMYVRSLDQPAIHTLSLPGTRSGGRGTPAQRGMAVFTELCQNCHGEAGANGIHSMDRVTMIPVKELGADRIRRTVRGGIGQMPPFENDELTDSNLDALVAFLEDPAAGRRGDGGRFSTPVPPPPAGVTRYTAPLGSMFRTANGLPAIGPPWASIVAYDLNEGTIKWNAPLGTVPALAAKGIKDTGNPQRTHRNGPAVTAGGLIFIGTWGDRTVHAYDKDTGKIVWERQLEASPEGIAAVYEAGGRQYVAFCASGTAAQQDGSATENISFVPGKLEAQGYYVFALPKTASSRK
ncbi:MAG TPA: PQQ-binding-like beta-propeller repeat protein [Bryobacteraceae bacterium]|nr:PQQ-binding-like beta-propeller repeat protein [Bryobacteraceae bacterium]